MANDQERRETIYEKLFKQRIIYLAGPVDGEGAIWTIAALLYLQSEDAKKPISVYITSPGGGVSLGLAIYDTMQFVKCEIHTYCIGFAASMAAVLLAAGTKGKRFVLPNSEVMIHQPWSPGMFGQATDVELEARHLMKTKGRLNQILAYHTGQTAEAIEKATDRNNWLTAEQSKDFGLVDQIIDLKKLPIPAPASAPLRESSPPSLNHPEPQQPEKSA